MQKFPAEVSLSLILAAVCSVHGQEGKNVFQLLEEIKPAVNTDDLSSWLRGAATPDSGPNYPTLSEIPVTSFRCEDMAAPGFFADVETQCQVFRRCDLQGANSSFICVNGTIFNQITLT